MLEPRRLHLTPPPPPSMDSQSGLEFVRLGKKEKTYAKTLALKRPKALRKKLAEVLSKDLTKAYFRASLANPSSCQVCACVRSDDDDDDKKSAFRFLSRSSSSTFFVNKDDLKTPWQKFSIANTTRCPLAIKALRN